MVAKSMTLEDVAEAERRLVDRGWDGDEVVSLLLSVRCRIAIQTNLERECEDLRGAYASALRAGDELRRAEFARNLEQDTVTHRPSRLDPNHTACGLPLDHRMHIQWGDGETCSRCTHVVAQVASALRREPSWAAKP